MLLRSKPQRPLLFNPARRQGIDEHAHHVYGAAPSGHNRRLSYASLASTGHTH